jgi:hypothetical protein
MARRPRQRSFAARYAPLLAAVVVVLVVVGLRTDDDLGVDLPGRTQAEATDDLPTTTTKDEDRPQGTLPTSTTNPVLDDPDDAPASLRQALLSSEDLPSGWRDAALGDQGTEVCPGHDPAVSVSPEHALKASFAQSDTGPFLTSFVAEFDGSDDADAYLDALEDALTDCDGLQDERGLTYSVERTEGADLGDRSVAATVEITTEAGGELRARILGVQVGDHIATIAFSAPGDADAAIAVDALETVVGRLD